MITVTILTKNSAQTLGATLDSLQHFPEVIILDSGSTDSTLQIAKKYTNVKIFERPFCGFGAMHNLASSLATYDWIFSVDSDEVVTPELAKELLSLSLQSSHVYSLLRTNFFHGKKITFCSGWYPDWVVRLYNRTTTSFTSDKVHEKIQTKDLSITKLKETLYHTPYRSVDDFLSKMQHYSTLFAEQNKGRIPSSLTKAIFHSLFAFCKSYFFKRGFLGGEEGFIISFYNAEVTYYKYLKLAEKRSLPRNSDPFGLQKSCRSEVYLVLHKDLQALIYGRMPTIISKNRIACFHYGGNEVGFF